MATDIRCPPGTIIWRNGALAATSRTASINALASVSANPRRSVAPSASGSTRGSERGTAPRRSPIAPPGIWPMTITILHEGLCLRLARKARQRHHDVAEHLGEAAVVGPRDHGCADGVALVLIEGTRHLPDGEGAEGALRPAGPCLAAARPPPPGPSRGGKRLDGHHAHLHQSLVEFEAVLDPLVEPRSAGRALPFQGRSGGCIPQAAHLAREQALPVEAARLITEPAGRVDTDQAWPARAEPRRHPRGFQDAAWSLDEREASHVLAHDRHVKSLAPRAHVHAGPAWAELTGDLRFGSHRGPE